MGARQTALDFSAFAINGSDYLAVLRSFDAHAAMQRVDTKGIAQRYEKKNNTSRSNRFSAVVMNAVAGDVKVNLDIALYTIGGAALLGNLKSGRIKVTNVDKNGKGAADLDDFAQLTATHYEVSGDLMVPTGEDADIYLQAGATQDQADFLGTVQITAGGCIFSAPMNIVECSVKTQGEEITTYSVMLEGHGAPTSPSTGDTLFGIAFASGQTAEIALYAETGVATLDTVTEEDAGDGMLVLIVGAEVSFADGAIVEEHYDFAAEGAISVTTATPAP